MTLRLALRRFGIDPEKDTKIIATGENPQRLAALSRNITQFTLLGEPLVREAEKMGFRDLVDIGTLKIPYHVNAVVTRESTVRTKRPFVMKVVRAFTEALHYIKMNKEDTKALIGKNLKVTDPEGLERAYRAYNAAFPEIPVSLGCARPVGPQKMVIDRLAIDAGLDGIAYPADGIVAYAQERGRTPRFHDACCGVNW